MLVCDNGVVGFWSVISGFIVFSSTFSMNTSLMAPKCSHLPPSPVFGPDSRGNASLYYDISTLFLTTDFTCLSQLAWLIGCHSYSVTCRCGGGFVEKQRIHKFDDARVLRAYKF